MTVDFQRALGAAWLQTDEARDQAHIELRHLGLPTALAHDLLAGAAYQLALDLSERESPFPSDEPLTPAYRALGSAARALLRARRTARPRPLASPTEPDRSPPREPAIPLDGARLRAGREVTDRRRRVVSGLAVDRPHERSAALTALTLATEPQIEPGKAAPRTDPGDLGRLIRAGLTYAGHVPEQQAPGALLPDRRAAATRRDHEAEAATAVERLLAEALATEDRGTGDQPGGDQPAPDARASTNELVHRKAAHG